MLTPIVPLVLNNSDSLRIEKYINTQLVPIDVEIRIPEQSETRVASNDSSHVETDLAESDAWVNPDGTLYHSIRNKAQNLKTQAMVPHTTEQNNKEAVKVKEIPVPQPYPIEIERKYTRAEQIKLASFWYIVGLLIVSIIYIFRKPLFTALRRIIGK